MKTFWMFGTIASFTAFNVFASDLPIPPSPFEKGKVIFNQPASTVITPSARVNDLIALVDMDCSKNTGLSELEKFDEELTLVDATPQYKTHRKILKVKTLKPVSSQRLEEFANASSCIIGISNEAEYHTTAAFSDPLLSMQTQHPFLHTADFYAKASWLPMPDSNRAVIAVVDTGVNYNHEDLTKVMYRKNGKIVGASFVTGTTDFMDDFGHGSHVAGLAAAEVNNNLGGAGVCGMSCYVMPVKVLDSHGSGSTSNIDNGIFWAVDNGADVINLSLGRSLNVLGMAPMDLEAFRYALLKNVTVAVAAGNDGGVLDPNGTQSWPGMFGPLPGVVTVASLDAATGNLSTFSNRGSHYVEIAAPGATSSVGGFYDGLLSTSKDGGYVKMSGTSMATPIVAGSMGLIISYLKKNKIAYTPWDVESVLKSATVVDSRLDTFVEGSRVLNLSILADRLQAHLDQPFRLNVQDAMEKFVNDLYYVVLRRDYDVGGAQYALSLMKDRKIPLETMLMMYFGSSEFKSSFGDINSTDDTNHYSVLVDHYIPDVYLALLGHLPSADDSSYWSEYLTVYRNKSRVLIRALSSLPEFDARIAGTTLAGYPRTENPSNDANSRCVAKNFPQGDNSLGAQVDFGYCIALERAPDAAGKNYFVGLLKNGVALEDVYLSFFKSKEFSDLNDLGNVSDGGYIRILYYTILQRYPKDFEWYYWTDALKTISRDQVVTAFIGSDEFKQILKNKGIRQ